jgi:hypothetical protein
MNPKINALRTVFDGCIVDEVVCDIALSLVEDALLGIKVIYGDDTALITLESRKVASAVKISRVNVLIRVAGSPVLHPERQASNA